MDLSDFIKERKAKREPVLIAIREQTDELEKTTQEQNKITLEEIRRVSWERAELIITKIETDRLREMAKRLEDSLKSLDRLRHTSRFSGMVEFIEKKLQEVRENLKACDTTQSSENKEPIENFVKTFVQDTEQHMKERTSKLFEKFRQKDEDIGIMFWMFETVTEDQIGEYRASKITEAQKLREILSRCCLPCSPQILEIVSRKYPDHQSILKRAHQVEKMNFLDYE